MATQSRQLLSWLLLALTLSCASPVSAALVTWVFDFGPTVDSGPSDFTDAKLIVQFDPHDVRAQSNPGQEVSFINWFVTSFHLVFEGTAYGADPSSFLAPFVGSIGIATRENISSGGDLDTLGVDLLVEGGRRFFVDLHSFSDFGHTDLFPFGFKGVPSPIGNIAPGDFFFNQAQFEQRPGFVERWTGVGGRVSEPSSLWLILIAAAMFLGLNRVRRCPGQAQTRVYLRRLP